jgi:hypothetical protein
MGYFTPSVFGILFPPKAGEARSTRFSYCG